MTRYLLDTHVILWFLEGNKKLPEKLKDFIQQQTNQITVSSISLWEISIKLNIDKLPTDLTIEDFINKVSEFWDIEHNINMQEIIIYRNLALHHRDPFDRMLIAQAQANNLTIITKDEHFNKYNVDIMW